MYTTSRSPGWGVIAMTCTGSGKPFVICCHCPSSTRRKIPLRLPAVNCPAPTKTRDALVMDDPFVSALPQLRVPGVPQRITEEVEPEDGEADGEAREDRQPGRLLHERSTGAAEHQSPRRRGRLGADAQEAERGLDEDRIAEPDRRDDQDRRRHVGQDVGDDDARMPAA